MGTPTVTTPRKPSIVLVALVVPLVALIALAVTRAVEGPSSASAASSGPSIVILDFAFSPRTRSVAAGTRLEVTNRDGTQHTLTAQDGSFDTGVLAGGAHTFITLRTPGTFRYHCNIHQNMTGELVVR